MLTPDPANNKVHHYASTSAAFRDQGGVDDVMAANSLIKVVVWCDGDSMRWRPA